MSTSSNNVKFGIFVLLAVVLFIAGLLAIGARSYFVPKSQFETAIPGEVSGLSVGSGVQLRGVPVGKVTRITFAWNVYPGSTSSCIVVEFEADDGLMPLPLGKDMTTAVKESAEKGLRAMVKGQGITGTSILALETLKPEDNPPPVLDYKPQEIYIPSAPGQFTRLLLSIEKSLHSLQNLDVASISQGVTNALAAVTKLTDKLGKVDLVQVTTNAAAVLTDVRELAAKLQGTVGQVEETLKGMKLGAVSQNANELVTGIRETNLKLQVVLDKVGAVPMQQTFGDLQQVLQTLNGVLAELKQYPSGFFLGQPPLPARSVQTPQK